MHQHWLAVVVTSCALAIGEAAAGAQARFEALTRDPVPALPGLEVVTIRDIVLNVCYAVFAFELPPIQPTATAQAPSIEQAAAERDRRLSELSASLQKGLVNATPGTLGPDVLSYEWEGLKAQSEFERVVREHEFARLDARLRQLVSAPKIAVSGPVACAAPASSVR